MGSDTNSVIDIPRNEAGLESCTWSLEAANFEKLKILLEQVCLQVAQRFSLYTPYGKPRKATIIETIARSTCLGCIAKSFSVEAAAKNVDALYKECHRLAVNVLVEELYNLLRGLGYNVMISTEAELEYGKADVMITITGYGINLRCKANNLLIEVKTGNSLSLCQLFRYLMDKRSDTIVVWRVRRHQILIFSTETIEPLVMEFVRMVCLRGTRLLSSPQLMCQHTQQPDYSPTQEELEKMLQDFSKALVETLPYVLEAITERLGIKNSEAKT
jgi:hypothetical protein